MPVYLFTFHAYRSWMPDRPQGYVRHEAGLLPPDPQAARRYARQAKHVEVQFNERQRWRLVDSAGEVSPDSIGNSMKRPQAQPIPTSLSAGTARSRGRTYRID